MFEILAAICELIAAIFSRSDPPRTSAEIDEESRQNKRPEWMQKQRS